MYMGYEAPIWIQRVFLDAEFSERRKKHGTWNRPRQGSNLLRKANQQPSTGTRSIFRKAIDHLLSASQLEQSKTLADVRQNLFELLTLIVFPVSTVPLLGGIYKSVQLDRWFVLALYILCYTILLVLFWARRRLAYVYRVSIALFLIYAFALFLLVRFGIPGAGIILFLTLCMVTSIFSRHSCRSGHDVGLCHQHFRRRFRNVHGLDSLRTPESG